jgi:ATP/maltotriose-dependent transcriptional regulator MalT/two-component SAPR family response regulator
MALAKNLQKVGSGADVIILPMEPTILLRTKFLVPRLGPDHLPRPHLIERLERSLNKRLILISAPPGYGKTTLLADFAIAVRLSPAWYQCDSADSDPITFLACLIESLRCSISDEAGARPLGAGALALLNSADSVTPQRVLTVLINELAERIDRAWLIVLEDYHVISNAAVHALVDYLIENAPPDLHLVISTRGDPPLTLARLRARGQLTELRTSDLRFTDQEIGAWLSRSAPGLSADSVRALSEKTEGWAASLQLALASLAGKDHSAAERIIDNLSGEHRFVFEYLAEEVFRRQPPDTQRFLLRTAVLEQMDAASCNAMLGIAEAQTLLERVEADNLFVFSLDEDRHWYRYHHLFREFLLGKLRREQPADANELERAAGAFYEARGEPDMALAHYFRGDDIGAAARVIALIAPDYLERGRVEVLQRYLTRLPDQVIQAHPAFLLYHGDALRRLGRAGDAIARYEEALAVYGTRGETAGICRALTELGEIARSQGDYRRAQLLATEALTAAPAADHAVRARALMALAKSEGFLTNTDRGRALAEEAVAEARLSGAGMSRRSFAALLQSLGQICWWQGDPQATVRYCEEALHTVPDELSPIAAEALITMATPHLYWGDCDTALRCAERALEISQQLQLTELLPMAYTTLGNALTRRGETARAESCLRQAMELSQGLGLETYARIMAVGYLAYNLCGQNRLDEARQLAESAIWPYVGSADSYEVCVCRSVLADVALEADRLDEAEQLFNGLIEVEDRRKFRVPLALVYFGLAYIHLRRQHPARGFELARESLRLIEPTGAHQLYCDQGERARSVCQALIEGGVRSPFITRVLDSLPHPDRIDTQARVSIVSPSAVVVHCLGRFQVTIGHDEIDQERWVSTKARDLLAYFITFRRERIPIERVLDGLWPETASRAKTAFHTALYRLRHALATPDQAARFILVEAGEYWLDAARFQVDVDEFDAALAKARAVRLEDAAPEYERAVHLYDGEYLDNLYYDWVMPERQRLREAHLAALRALAAHRFQTGGHREALDLIQRALKTDPLVEEDHCTAMRLLARLGDRAGVMRQYQQLEQQLREELGAAPLVSTRHLYEMLIGT